MYSEEKQTTPEHARRTAGGRARAHGRTPLGRPASGGPLDTSTNNSAIASHTAFRAAVVDRSTGELLPGWDPTRKWMLQSAARGVLNGHRIGVCMRVMRRDWHEVQIRQSSETGRAYYAGLMACGSVWACPVCAAKIQAVRASEVRAAIAAAAAEGLVPAMLTLTVPHTRHDDLARLLRAFTGALGGLVAARAWKDLAVSVGLAGYVRALEVTWGEASGWHPHAHVVLFLPAGVELEQLAAAVWPLWRRSVERRGLGEASRKAFTLQDATAVSDYFAKAERAFEVAWGPAEELVRGHTKSAGRGRFSPWDLLGELAYGDDGAGDRARFAVLFRTYAETFHGRRQLQWSQGLKRRLLGTDGPTDQQVADSLGQLDAILAALTADDWQLVYRARRRGDLLLVAELHGRQGVELFLAGLRQAAG